MKFVEYKREHSAWRLFIEFQCEPHWRFYTH